jgi:hypothetical protein
MSAFSVVLVWLVEEGTNAMADEAMRMETATVKDFMIINKL